FSSRRRHTRLQGDWSSDVCSSDLGAEAALNEAGANLLLADLPLADRVPPVLERNRIDGVLLKGALQGDLFGGGNPALFERLRERSEERRVGKVWVAVGGVGVWKKR